MTNYAVLGLGLMGEAIVHDLLTFDKTCTVYGFELEEQRRLAIDEKFDHTGRFISYPLNLDLSIKLKRNPCVTIFREKKITSVFGAIDYSFNAYLSEICILAGANYFDLGGNPEMVAKQQTLSDKARTAGVTIIPDLGLAPGMANIIASHIIKKFTKVEKCDIRVGGLPQVKFKKSILNYQQVFSIRGLTNEYLEDAVILKNGKKELVQSLTEIEEIEFPEPFGKLEAFQTAGGTSSLPDIYEGKIDHLSYKTIRYPGHAQFFQFLKEYHLLESSPYPKNTEITPREIIEHYLETNLPKGDPDAVLIRITVIGTMESTTKKIEYQLIDYFDEETKFTAMARTTAYPISIVGQLVSNGIITEKGVLRSEEAVPEDSFEFELERRNIVFTKNV